MSINFQWGTVADWVSGIGSLSAALVALYIAYDTKKVRLRGFAGHRTVVRPSITSDLLETFTVSATNVSQRPTKITNISLSMGLFFKKRNGIILFMESPISHGIPLELSDGSSGSWSVEIGTDENWVATLVTKFKMKWIDAQTLRIIVHTSNGGSTKLVPEKGFRKMLLKHISQAKSQALD